MVNVAREAMLAIGCIQAQKCHTDTCPTGVATQNAWLAHGLDPALKSVRAANYVRTLRRDLLKVAEACGVEHPGPDRPERGGGARPAGRRPPRCTRCTATEPGWGLPSAADRAEIVAIMTAEAPQGGSRPALGRPPSADPAIVRSARSGPAEELLERRRRGRRRGPPARPRPGGR